MPDPRRSPRLLVAVATAVLAGVALTACTATAPAPTTPSSTVSATPTVQPVALVPEGTAEQNLPWFTQIVGQVWAGPEQAQGRAYVDALVAGGFDKSAMQVTADESTVGNAAESIQFSVLWHGECLVGQVGPATGEPVAVVLPVLGTGGCLLGRTRPIDW